MSSLHDMALRQYTEHYERINPTTDPLKMTERLYRNMELMFGRFLDPLPTGSRIADLGCGTGFLLYWLARRPHLHLLGVDASDTQVTMARKAVPSADISHGLISDFLGKENATLNGVFCLDVLEHLETEDELFHTLVAIERALVPGGFFICRVPNAAHILGSYSRHMDLTHYRSFTSHSLRQALMAGGFTNIKFIPTQSSILLGKTRLFLEQILHRALFMLGGYTREDTFTQNVIAVAYKCPIAS